MKQRRNYRISQFYCPRCYAIITVPRLIGKLRRIHHVKDLYCPICQKDFKGVENELLTLEEAEKLRLTRRT